MNGEPALRTTALRLQYATVAWNAGEAVLTISLGLAARSLALVAFGADSVIELFASMVVIWHIRRDDEGGTPRALRLLGIAFGALAVVLGAAAVRDLSSGRVAHESPWGMLYLAVTVFVMLALGVAKRRVGRRLGSEPITREGDLTILDGALATATVAGLALNAWLGWWWADPAAALIIAILAANEAREALSEARKVDRSPT